MITLAYRLDRSLVIRATPATVFEFFTNSDDWAAWWGAGSRIDARPGGSLLIRHANGVEASGEIIEVQPPERIVFTYGYAAGGEMPAGSSRVTIRLDRHPAGTLLQLSHEFDDVQARDEHVQGWRYQLSLFANAVANKAAESASATIDRWFAVWSDPDASTRDAGVDRMGAADLRFEDRFSSVHGADEVKAHLAAVHRFMPGMRLERRGDIRYCQWHALADWVALTSGGQERGRGTNLFVFDADGRLTQVTGFWMQ